MSNERIEATHAVQKDTNSVGITNYHAPVKRKPSDIQVFGSNLQIPFTGVNIGQVLNGKVQSPDCAASQG